MNKKGYTIKELLIVICVFSVIYLIGVLSVAHAFKYDKITEDYNATIALISIYANDLVKNKYFNADDNGYIIDPRDTTKNLNDLQIEITKDNNTYTAIVK